MNRIMIGCLALLFAGCCKNDPQDCRLVGTWSTNGSGDPFALVARFEESGDVSTGWFWDGEVLSDPMGIVSYSTWATSEGMLTFSTPPVGPHEYIIFSRGDSLEMLDFKFGKVQ